MAIHHLQLWVPDLDRATESWGWLLDQLGYRLDAQRPTAEIWLENDHAIVIEKSPDMVPGMLHSRFRPGMNHVAFRVSSAQRIAEIVAEASQNGWQSLEATHKHKLPKELKVAYLEDRDGFEVELIADTETT